MSEASERLLERQRPDLVGKAKLIQEGRILLPPAKGRSFVDRAEGFVFSRLERGDLLLDDADRWAHFRKTPSSSSSPSAQGVRGALKGGQGAL
jgi:hypothetical protein